ncbi:MAG: cupin domain-containing protein [Gemmatimonadetes bacterium]|nr:cupin domain-containing protein [Gemmatimonadota bacterium]
MHAFADNLAHLAAGNQDYRRVLHTGPHQQLVLMTLQPGEEVGEEVHLGVDQLYRIELGNGEIVINGNVTPVSEGWAVVVPAGMRHNLRNTGTQRMRLTTLYAPPVHPAGTLHPTKATSEAAATTAAR